MILGTGVDIIEVDRIRGSYERFGERFVRRILSDGELGYCLAHRDPAPFLAARFAAKEAISKAFGTGIGGQLGWQDMEVGRKSTGEPFVILHDQGLLLLKERGADHVHLTLSHTQVYAVAMALLECRSSTAPPTPTT
jgi:holo-[acyl-carrier protein] synthase